MLDVAINSGLVMDGGGGPARVCSVGVRNGVVVALREQPFAAAEARTVVDARGRWVMPGFIDCHTHYDAELEGAPALVESLRHGVTTVMVGGCSLGAVYATPVDIADMFARVEGIPRTQMLPLMERVKTWEDARGYREHLGRLALGPNVAALVGHSDVRAAVMGLGRSVTAGERPTTAELDRMSTLLEDALDHGFLGLSVNANTWDKLDGTRFRSQPLPSTFARWGEVQRLTAVLRRRQRIFQGIPNISTKVNALLFLWESTGLGRAALKTNLVSMVDVRSNRHVSRALGRLSRLVNTLLRGAFRWQALPVPFDIFADGVDVPVFEEFGAGTAALHLADLAERRALFRDPAYRRFFRRQWTNWLLPRVFHRDFNQSRIERCPDASLVGMSFGDVARQRGQDVVETFLDLCAQHNEALRWSTVIGNDRPGVLRHNLQHPDILIGFSDAGAHLRNMAFYNMQLRMLRMARDAQKDGIPFLTPEQVVWRCTGELADWFGLDAGHLVEGARADVVVVNPDALDERVDALHLAPIPEFGGYERMVRRNDEVVEAVLVGGEVAWTGAGPSAALGQRPLGVFLGYGEKGARPNGAAARGATQPAAALTA